MKLEKCFLVTNTITFLIWWTIYGKIISKILGRKCSKNHISRCLCLFNPLFNWLKQTSTTEDILSILKKKQGNLDLTKVISNISHKYNLAFKLFLWVIAIWYFPTLCFFIEITAEHIGYKKMTEIISFKVRS